MKRIFLLISLAIIILEGTAMAASPPQYKGLEALYEKYKDRGLVILGFPANLTESSHPAGAISWNFNKFLIGPDGRIIGRWGSKITSDPKELTTKLEETLR